MPTPYACILGCVALLATACGSGSRAGNVDAGNVDTVDECLAGVTRCEGRTRLECGRNGTFMTVEQCPDVCEPGLGCVVCTPGSSVCDAGAMMVRS